MVKKCFKCEAHKELSEFYKHPQMPDGHVNKCKECNKKDVRDNRSNKVDYYRDYDKKRGYRQGYEYIKEYRARFPNKYKAHSIVNRCIKNGSLVNEKCQECGREEDTHAHHDDYLKPLNIRWLCPPCHKQWHNINGEGLNG